MVILGGLELVAAGVIFHKYNKGKEQERELEREQDRRSRERKHGRKHHHHRRDSPPQHTRKENGKESSLYPPQHQAHRAHSAPPPGYSPNWQSQPTYYPPQSWLLQQNEKAPAWHPQPNNYPPTWQAPAHAQSQPYPYPYPQSQSYAHQQPPQLQPQSQQYAHPQPPQPQPQPSMYPTPHHDDAALSEILQRGPPNVGNQPAFRLQPRPTAVAPPDANYAELSADSSRIHDTKAVASPHVTFAVPGDESRNDHQTDPPPAYQDYPPGQRE